MKIIYKDGHVDECPQDQELHVIRHTEMCIRDSLGGAVAQRLRGYKWRSEKSVKAIAPTGAALAFLCFDFFFRFVNGVQPLTRCGVGGVQR